MCAHVRHVHVFDHRVYNRDANINIASFDLGRRDAGDEAICVVSVDQRIDEGLLKRIVELPNVVQARVLAF